MNKITTEEFIKRAKKIHKNKFSYEKTVYINHKTKITVSCKIHGDNETNPYYFLKGIGGCKKCGFKKQGLAQRGKEKKKSWKNIEIEQLKILYPDTKINDISILLNKSRSQIFYMINRLGIATVNKNETYKEYELEILKEFYNKATPKEISKMLKRSVKSIRIRANKLGLTGTKDNKHDVYHAKNIESVKKFGKNLNGKNYFKSIRINGKNIPYHRYLYIEHYGSIPDKHVVLFKDGNRLNFDIDNLIAVENDTIPGLKNLNRYKNLTY